MSVLPPDSLRPYWVDFSDMSTLFQDAEGKIPVTEIGQTVGSFKCKATGDIHKILVYGNPTWVGNSIEVVLP